MSRLTREEARERLAEAGVAVGTNFFTLPNAAVCRLLELADRDHYRQPRNANGSRGRYYHARLERAASRSAN